MPLAALLPPPDVAADDAACGVFINPPYLVWRTEPVFAAGPLGTARVLLHAGPVTLSVCPAGARTLARALADAADQAEGGAR